MRFSILFSPTKGFWSEDYGWVKHCNEATQLPIDAIVQLGFLGTRDISLIPSNEVSTLNTHELKTWLKTSFFELYETVFKHVNDLLKLIELTNIHTTHTVFFDGKTGLSLVKKIPSLPFEKVPLVAPYKPGQKHNKLKK